MAVKAFNCNKIKRTFWPITLKEQEGPDGTKIPGKTLVVRMPQKGVFEAIKAMEIQEEENHSAEDANAVYELLSAVLSNNMKKEKVEVEELEDYDIEECTAILDAYMEFVDELKTDPN